MTKKKETDPHAKREADKYENPIPSREFILELLTQNSQPLSRRQITKLLDLKGEDQNDALRRRLRAMERDGQLLRNRKNAYGVMSKMNLVTGRVQGHADGFGFLIPDDGGDDLFLSEKHMHQVLHGDRVVARVSGVDRRGRKEGTIIEVLERANETVVGRLGEDGGMYYLIPNNRRISQDIMVSPKGLLDAKSGQIVEVAITEHPTKHRSPLGKVVKVLGDHMAPGMEIDIALRAFDLPHEWADEVVAEAEAYGESIPKDAIEGRLDLREMPLMTIDGEDARDFDDAVYAEKVDGGGWRLWVAIADVSTSVKPGCSKVSRASVSTTTSASGASQLPVLSVVRQGSTSPFL